MGPIHTSVITVLLVVKKYGTCAIYSTTKIIWHLNYEYKGTVCLVHFVLCTLYLSAGHHGHDHIWQRDPRATPHGHPGQNPLWPSSHCHNSPTHCPTYSNFSTSVRAWDMPRLQWHHSYQSRTFHLQGNERLQNWYSVYPGSSGHILYCQHFHCSWR